MNKTEGQMHHEQNELGKLKTINKCALDIFIKEN